MTLLVMWRNVALKPRRSLPIAAQRPEDVIHPIHLARPIARLRLRPARSGGVPRARRSCLRHWYADDADRGM